MQSSAPVYLYPFVFQAGSSSGSAADGWAWAERAGAAAKCSDSQGAATHPATSRHGRGGSFNIGAASYLSPRFVRIVPRTLFASAALKFIGLSTTGPLPVGAGKASSSTLRRSRRAGD